MDTVAIRIPASPEYLRVIRLVAAGLAARLKFTLEDIDDLKIAVDELSAYLTGSRGHDAVLEVRFDVHVDRIEITGTAKSPSGGVASTELSGFSRQILETVVDSASLQQSDGSRTFRLIKSRRS